MNLWLVSPDLIEATMHECGAMNALERFHSTNSRRSAQPVQRSCGSSLSGLAVP